MRGLTMEIEWWGPDLFRPLSEDAMEPDPSSVDKWTRTTEKIAFLQTTCVAGK